MNRLIAVLSSLLLCATLKGSQETYKLQRTYSTNPAADKLKSALQKGNIDKVRERIGLLPLGIDYQYVYLALARDLEVCTFFLESIFSDWLTRIQKHPEASLATLIVGLERLSKSYRLTELDHGFRLMLVKLRCAILKMECIIEHESLRAQAHQIPDYTFDENTLQMQCAYIAALQGSLENISENIIALMAKARHRSDIGCALNSMDTSE